jgi:hypothetical protein
MEDTGQTLRRRVTATLRARQYVVFFSIILFSLDLAVPLVSAWLYRGEPLAELLRHTWGPLADAIAARSLAIAAIFVVFVLLKTWLRAGYIRSLTGPFHPGAADRRQFFRLLGLELILQALAAVAVAVAVVAGDNLALAGAVVIGLLAIYLAIIYADYIIVLADVGPLRAIALSWRTVRSAFLLSALVLITVTLLADATSGLVDDKAAGGLAQAAPMLLVQCVLMGAVLFAADVALVSVYLDAAEHGRLGSGEKPSR